MNDVTDGGFAVIDVEGNGQQPPEIVEIGVVVLDGIAATGEPVSWMVRPTRPITSLVTHKVHGITNADVLDAPTIDALAPTILDVLGDRIPIAHNAVVERAVLGTQLPDWKPPVFLDTLRLARKVWPGLKSYGLDPLLRHAGIALSTDGQRHRAGHDAAATARLFTMLAAAVNDRQQLIDWAALPVLEPPAEPEGALW